jgi:zinc transporter 9
MLLGSFVTGLIPIMIKASNRFMNLISILGAGLLVGVALIIIIPEGMLTLNTALANQKEARMKATMATGNYTLEQFTQMHMPSEADGSENTVSLYLGGSLIFGFLIMLLVDQFFHIIRDRFGSHDTKNESDETASLKEKFIKRTDCKYIQNSVNSTRGGCMKIMRAASVKPQYRFSDDFTDQKLIDTVGNVYVRHGHDGYVEMKENDEHEHDDSHSHDHAHEHFHGDKGNLIITTLGLVVHSIADGVALGSTCYASQDKDTSLPLIIFMALFLHKCPAAIGLTTFLRHEMLPFKEILLHLT